MKTKYLWVLVLPFVFAACSSKNGSVAFNPKADKIIDQSGETPDWINQSSLAFVKGDKVFRIGVAEAPSDSSPRKVTELAATYARGSLAREIKNKLESRSQAASESLGIEKTVLEKVITEGSRIDNMNGVRTEEVFYQRVARSDGYNEQVVHIGYALISVPMKEFQRQLRLAVRGNMDRNLSKQFEEKVNRAWSDMFHSNEKIADTDEDKRN